MVLSLRIIRVLRYLGDRRQDKLFHFFVENDFIQRLIFFFFDFGVLVNVFLCILYKLLLEVLLRKRTFHR